MLVHELHGVRPLVPDGAMVWLQGWLALLCSPHHDTDYAPSTGPIRAAPSAHWAFLLRDGTGSVPVSMVQFYDAGDWCDVSWTVPPKRRSDEAYCMVAGTVRRHGSGSLEVVAQHIRELTPRAGTRADTPLRDSAFGDDSDLADVDLETRWSAVVKRRDVAFTRLVTTSPP